MKNIFTKYYFRFFAILSLSFFATQSIASVHFTESFTTPNFPVSSWAGPGTATDYTLASGTWNVQYTMGLEALNAYNSSGGAAKLNRYLESYITTPVVNTVGTVSFYYRNFSTSLGGGSFKVQKSVNGAAFTDLATITYTSASAYTYYSIPVNDVSSNVKIRIYCAADNNRAGYLCIDEITVTDLTQTLAASPSSLSGLNYYIGSGPSASQSFNLFGSNLSGAPGNIAVTAPTDYEVSINNTTFSTSINVPYSTATLSATPVYVHLKAGLSINTYNSELISVSGGGATAFTISCSGSVTTAPLPAISVNPTTLSGFTYVFGSGPSVAQSYSVIGTDLTGYPGNIVVTAPTDYEVSLDYSTYSASVNVPYTGATLASLLVYVRLKAGLAVSTYNSETITNVGGGASGNVVCNGSVSPPPAPTLSAGPTTLTGFTYIVGAGPSTAQLYNLSGGNLTGYPSNIAITAPTDYEISLSSGSGYATGLNVPYTSATLASTPIYVRLKAGLAIASYNSEIIANAGGGATTVNVTCNGSVTAAPSPLLSLGSSTLTGFTYIVGSGPSTPQSYNLSGSYLTGYPSNIAITAPTDYEISLSSGSGYATSLNVPYTSATLASTPIYVRLKAGLAIASYNSEIVTNAGGGATTVNVTCSGSVTAAPSPLLSLGSSTLTGFTYVVGSGPSVSQSYNLSGSYLTGYPSNIAITAPTDYEISLSSGTGYATILNIPYTSATLASTPIYVRLKAGLAIASYNSEIIANAGGGATTVNVTCSGSVTDIVTGPCFSEDFSSITIGDNTTTSGSGTAWTGNTNFPNVVKAYQAGGAVKLGSSSAIGSITSMPLTDVSGDVTVSFNVKGWSTVEGGIKVTLNGVSQTVTYTAIYSGTFENKSVDFTNVTAGSTLTIETTAKRAFIDNVVINCGVVTAISESKESLSVSVYPNPANERVTVVNIPSGVKEIRIFDVTGNMVNSIAVENRNNLNVDLTALSKGVYFLNLIDENNASAVHKIIKL
jgi:hypothetical protein